jgi:hypothetical protein
MYLYIHDTINIWQSDALPDEENMESIGNEELQVFRIGKNGRFEMLNAEGGWNEIKFMQS